MVDTLHKVRETQTPMVGSNHDSIELIHGMYVRGRLEYNGH